MKYIPFACLLTWDYQLGLIKNNKYRINLYSFWNKSLIHSNIFNIKSNFMIKNWRGACKGIMFGHWCPFCIFQLFEKQVSGANKDLAVYSFYSKYFLEFYFILNQCLITFIKSADWLFTSQISRWCVETPAAQIWKLTDLLLEPIWNNEVVLFSVL